MYLQGSIHWAKAWTVTMAVLECATGTHNCVSCYGADESGVTPGAPERVITTKVSLVIVQLVSGLMKVKCVLTLTNATPTTENAMAMLIASMM